MATRRVLCCWLLVATWQYLSCFCTTAYSGNVDNDISTPKISTTNINSSPQPAVDACSTITTSSSLVVPTSTSTQPQTSSETDTTPQSTDASVDNTRTTSTERLTSSTELSQYQPPTTSHTSSSEMTPSTNGSEMCTCIIKLPPNVSMVIPAMHRNTTSKYRRSHNSEWGSPSVYTSTSSATFVIVVGVAGCLLVVCDFNRFAGVCGKGRSLRQRDKVSHP